MIPTKDCVFTNVKSARNPDGICKITPGLNKPYSITFKVMGQTDFSGIVSTICKIRIVKTVKTCPYCERELKVVSIAPDYSFIIWRCDVHGCLRFDYSAKKWVLSTDSTESVRKNQP